MRIPVGQHNLHPSPRGLLEFIRSLQRRPVREAERAFVVEGERAIVDALEAGADIRDVVARADATLSEHTFAALQDARIPLTYTSARYFDRLSELKTPPGLLAVINWQPLRPVRTETPLGLLVDEVRDPGNLGTLLRSAVGAGVTQVWVSSGTVDVLNPKVVRGAMGAHFRVPIATWQETFEQELRTVFPLRVVADARADALVEELDWRGASLLMVGSEAEGISDRFQKLATVSARVPLLGGMESLNAGVAGSIMLFEASRQRRGTVSKLQNQILR